MTELLQQELCNEIREEFRIPLFFSDEALTKLILESDYDLSTFVSNIDYDVDLTARSLLKNRVFYAYSNRTFLFQDDYKQEFLTWQFSKFGGVVDD